MSDIRRVLFPVDLSLKFRSLSPTARKLFDRPGVEIIMLHAIEEPPRTGRGTEVERAVMQMEFMAHKDFQHAKITLRTDRGPAAGCILDCAESRPVDVIVMPAGGLDSLRRNSPGHVTEEVLDAASCAVWFEWMSNSVEAGNEICCMLGLDDGDEAAICQAVAIARQLESELTLVHAAESSAQMLPWVELRDSDRSVHFARRRVEQLRERYAPAATLHVEKGHPDTVVSRILHRRSASLLIDHGQTPNLFAASLACPVLRLAKAKVLELAAAVGRKERA